MKKLDCFVYVKPDAFTAIMQSLCESLRFHCDLCVTNFLTTKDEEDAQSFAEDALGNQRFYFFIDQNVIDEYRLKST